MGFGRGPLRRATARERCRHSVGGSRCVGSWWDGGQLQERRWPVGQRVASGGAAGGSRSRGGRRARLRGLQVGGGDGQQSLGVGAGGRRRRWARVLAVGFDDER